MSEGPQVRLRTEWLEKWCAGRTIHKADTGRPACRKMAEALEGLRIIRCWCKGKHIFMETEGGPVLHNHLLMRGKWRKREGQMLFLEPACWLGLYLGPYTVCNLNGQMLVLREPRELERELKRIGPDVMTRPAPMEEVLHAWSESPLPASEVLLRQEVASGLGNVARSEALYLANLDPCRPGCELRDEELARLWKTVQKVMWDSYESGGRWTHRVYRRAGRRCEACGTRIRHLRLKPSRRTTYFCPGCQH